MVSTQTHPSLQALTPGIKRLVRLMQTLNFGQIRLAIRNGEPDFGRGFRTVRMFKMAGNNGPRPEVRNQDFDLKSEVRELFSHLANLNDGVVCTIEVKHGLPFMIEIKEEHQV